MSQVVLEGVSKSYGRGELAVDGIDLEVQDEEFLVLVGPSGCGKTTTLRMIAGLETITSGTIRIGDRVVNAVPPKDRDIAMVFQNYALYPHMTVYKNMAFGLELRYGGGWLSRSIRRVMRPKVAAELEVKRRQIKDRVGQAARTLGIEHLLKRKPHQLSGGERQRVALGRSIVREPAAFLFDEPLSNLDARLRTEMRVELKRLHRQLSATMIYVTHDQVEALTLGDRIAVMKGGEILQVGAPMAVYDEPYDTFVATFIGSPGMNLLDGKLVSEDGRFLFRSGDHEVALDRDAIPADLHKALQSGSSESVTIGIRPEDVEILGPAEEDRVEGGHFQGDVVAVDRLGDSAMLYLSIAGELRQSTRREASPNQSIDETTTEKAKSKRNPNDARSNRNSETGDQVGAISGDSAGHVKEWVVKTEGRTGDLTGRAVSFRLDLNRVHLFDKTTGINLLKAGRK